MVQYFVFGGRIFAVHSEFQIEWYEWHKVFLKENIDDLELPVTHYYIACYEQEPDVERWKYIYGGRNQSVYQGEHGEVRVHHLLGSEISIYCEEINGEYYIWINPVLKQEAYMYFVAMMLEKVFLENDALILHSAYLKHDEGAILFTAPSGVGKSTQADLWVKYAEGRVVNGDRAILRKIEDRWHACGFPICGTSKICYDENESLRAIVYLKQAKENRVHRLEGFQAFRYILSEVSVNYWNPEAQERALRLVEEICSEVDIYLLECTPTEEAVNVLLEELRR